MLYSPIIYDCAEVKRLPFTLLTLDNNEQHNEEYLIMFWGICTYAELS